MTYLLLSLLKPRIDGLENRPMQNSALSYLRSPENVREKKEEKIAWYPHGTMSLPLCYAPFGAIQLTSNVSQ